MKFDLMETKLNIAKHGFALDEIKRATPRLPSCTYRRRIFS
jgi:hypothetical protein